MQTVFLVLAKIMPLIWWPVCAAAIYVYSRIRSFPLVFIVLGSLLLGLIGLQLVLFRPDSTIDAYGNAKVFTVGLLSVEAHVIASSIGTVLVVVGLLMLLLYLLRHRVDT